MTTLDSFPKDLFHDFLREHEAECREWLSSWSSKFNKTSNQEAFANESVLVTMPEKYGKMFACAEIASFLHKRGAQIAYGTFFEHVASRLAELSLAHRPGREAVIGRIEAKYFAKTMQAIEATASAHVFRSVKPELANLSKEQCWEIWAEHFGKLREASR